MAGALLVALLAGTLLLRTSGPTTPDGVAVEAPAGEAPATQQAMIGEEARDGQLVFVVEGFSCRAKSASADPVEARATGRICTLRFTVKNSSSSPATLLGRFQYLVGPESRTYGADDALTRAVPENRDRGLSEMNVNPEVEVPLVYVFDLPDTVEPTQAQFRGTGRGRFGVSVRLQARA